MGFFQDVLGTGGSNPANAAMPYFNQIPDLYEPYRKQGMEAYGPLKDIYSQQMQNPAAFLENLMQQYEPSRAYQLRKDEALQSAGNTAAAGGMRGSLNDITNQSRLTDALLGEDMQQWLNNVMGIQNTGLGGTQGFYNAGLGATSDFANALGTQGQLAFQGQGQQNASAQNLLGSFLGAGAMGAGAYFGGGGMGGGGAGGGGSTFYNTMMPGRLGGTLLGGGR